VSVKLCDAFRERLALRGLCRRKLLGLFLRLTLFGGAGFFGLPLGGFLRAKFFRCVVGGKCLALFIFGGGVRLAV
jgi:hypothetical protein